MRDKLIKVRGNGLIKPKANCCQQLPAIDCVVDMGTSQPCSFLTWEWPGSIFTALWVLRWVSLCSCSVLSLLPPTWHPYGEGAAKYSWLPGVCWLYHGLPSFHKTCCNYLIDLNLPDAQENSEILSVPKSCWIWWKVEAFIYQQHRACKHGLSTNNHETEDSLNR